MANIALENGSPTCAGLRDSDLPTLVQYGHYLQLQAPPNATLRTVQEALMNATNDALDNCSSLEDYLGFNATVRLSRYPKRWRRYPRRTNGLTPFIQWYCKALIH